MVMIWGNACDTVIKPIQTIQNRMIRNMYEFDRLQNRIEMYKKVADENILPIRAMNFLSTASFIYMCRSKSIHTKLTFESYRGIRSRMTLRPTAAKNNLGKKRYLPLWSQCLQFLTTAN